MVIVCRAANSRTRFASSISNFRTPKSGTSAASSINNTKLLKTNEGAVAPLPEL